MTIRLLAGALLSILLSLVGPVALAGPTTVYLEDLTTREVGAAVSSGMTTVIIPVGGIEQSGPAMVLGKHNRRAYLLAGRIARELGNALVAPVVTYVPEGRIDPPTEHMRFAGTISVPAHAFEEILEAIAASLRQHGFHDVVFIGDHGGYQENLREVARHLNKAWSAGSGHAFACTEYYAAAAHEYDALLRKQGFTAAQVGTHAGLADTSLSLALDPGLVRGDVLAHEQFSSAEGVYGDPRGATAELGAPGIELIVQKSVAAIRAAITHP